MPGYDSGADRPELGPKKLGRPRGTVGAHKRTLELGERVIEELAIGTPLRYLAEAVYSHAPLDLERDERGLIVVKADGPRAEPAQRVIARRLRNARAAVLRASGQPVTPLPTSPAVGRALRAFHEHGDRHRDAYLWIDGSAAARRAAPQEYWASPAKLIALRIDLESAMARASGRDRTEVITALRAQLAAAALRGGGRVELAALPRHVGAEG